MKNKSLDKRIKYLLLSFGVSIAYFTLFRLGILGFNLNATRAVIGEKQGISLLLKAMFMGFRFDSLVSCFILAIFIISLLTSFIINRSSKLFYKINHYLIVSLFSISFLISLIDLPYFMYFFTRFNVDALMWMDSPGFVFKMIFQEKLYLTYFLIMVVIIASYIVVMNKVYKKTLGKKNINRNGLNSVIFVLIIGLCFLGMRGRIALKSPIRVGTAYFSSNPYVNQLGLNTVYVFAKSMEEKSKLSKNKIELIDSETAKRIIEKEVLSKEWIINENGLRDYNLVLVIMESMSLDYLNQEGVSLTPILDKIRDESLSFENTYTAGIHTYNGVYSTLFSEPAILNIHSMKTNAIPELYGLPQALKESGYTTLYFTTHDDQFDNIGGFLKANSIDRIISEKDYPKSEVKTTLGVPDHIMFRRALEEIDQELSQNKGPIFSCLLSSSFHSPFYLPKDIDFEPKSNDIKNKMLEYSDWAIGDFMEKAKEKDWFENTVFVFIADHGGYLGQQNYEITLSYHRTPFLIYSPNNIENRKEYKPALQIDLAPTLANTLGLSISNNIGLGIDLNNYSREYAYFSSDNKVGVIDEEYLYVWNKESQEFLYSLSMGSKNIIKEDGERAKLMREYAFSMIQHSYDRIYGNKKRD